MERSQRQKYIKEFREQAVRLVLDQELTILEAAKRLAISEKMLVRRAFRSVFYEPDTSPVFNATLRAMGTKG